MSSSNSTQPVTVRDLMNDVANIVKRASDGPGCGIKGEAPSSIPGSEHDAAPPAGMKKDDPEVREVSLPSADSAAAVPLEQRSGLDSDHTPHAQKPAVSADFYAPLPGSEKSALHKAAMALLAGIDAIQKKANAQASAKPAAPKPQSKTAAAPAATAPAAAAPTKPKTATARTNVDVDGDLLRKVAAIILSTEEGVVFTQNLLSKVAGAEAANEALTHIHGMRKRAQAQEQARIQQQQEQEQGLRKIAEQAYLQGQQDVMNKVAQEQAKQAQAEQARLEAIYHQMSPEEQQAFVKGAQDQTQQISLEQQQRQAFEKGAQDAQYQLQKQAMIKEAGTIVGDAAFEKGASDTYEFVNAFVRQAQVGDLVGSIAVKIAQAEGQMPPGAAEGAADQMGAVPPGQDISLEEVQAYLEQAVAQQQISPEDAQKILQQFQAQMQGEGGAVTDDGAGAPPAGEGEGESSEGEGEAAADDDKSEKSASLKDQVTGLLATLASRRQ